MPTVAPAPPRPAPPLQRPTPGLGRKIPGALQGGAGLSGGEGGSFAFGLMLSNPEADAEPGVGLRFSRGLASYLPSSPLAALPLPAPRP